MHLVETLGIKIKEDHFKEKFYLDKINSLPKGRYFLSDLDGTFFRGFLIKEVFAVFIKYFKDLDVDKISLNVYKEFIEDYKLFREMEKQAINRQIDYLRYICA
ncbi:TPA: hypothetical protein EYP13_01645 [Candidatus Micrarchaeota archaeon]|nr:hypothetical protein [Candidatus Micrarchaeota archaeon]